ncbi:ion channel [Methanobrevibacter sp.]|uniref:ion channel n=1 Tax=Methanobrevibacter sp. TaxID=66852 RepID=UPI0038691D68
MVSTRRRVFYLIIIILTFIDILFLGYSAFFSVSSTFRYSAIAYDLIICIILWAEFIYSYRHSKNKKKYLKDNSFSILGMFPIDFVFLRALRLVKLVQLIKLYVLARETTGNISKFLKHTLLDKIIFIAIMFIFIITVSIRLLDPAINDIPTAIWFIVVSMTSTGYGDVVPVSHSGRLIGIIAMIGGILIFATVTAAISTLYMSKISRHHHDNLESKIDDLSSEIERLNKKIDELEK